MKTTHKSKTILNISIAISIMLCSLSLFIYSFKSDTANAQNSSVTDNGYKAVGVIMQGDYFWVIGYNSSMPDKEKIKVLAIGTGRE